MESDLGLSYDVWLIIFAKIPPLELLVSCSLVCKLWNQVIYSSGADSTLFRRLCSRHRQISDGRKNAAYSTFLKEYRECFAEKDRTMRLRRALRSKRLSWKSSSSNSPKVVLKIVALASAAAGSKTSLIQRWVKDEFSEMVDSTIGASFFFKVVSLQGYTVKYEIWDTAGQHRFMSMSPMYIRGADVVLLGYDITDDSSWKQVEEWLQMANKTRQTCGEKADDQLKLWDPVYILAAHKCDFDRSYWLPHNQTPSILDQWCKERNIAKWWETSAKENINISEMFTWVGEEILRRDGYLDLSEEVRKQVVQIERPGSDQFGASGIQLQSLSGKHRKCEIC